MRRSRYLIPIIAAVVLFSGLSASNALASWGQEAIFQDGLTLRKDPPGTMATLKALGVTRLRMLVQWNSIAPNAGSHRRPKNFNATNPYSYPAAGWSIYDTIVRYAAADGIKVDLDLTGPAPLWANAPGAPAGSSGQWRPFAGEFYAFVRAIGARYSGHFTPPGQTTLQRVSFWSVWNEPNYGIDLAPQGTGVGSIETGAMLYRNLVDAAWSGLHRSGHGHDAFLFGELAPHGSGPTATAGNFNGVTPIRFLRALYCVDSGYRQLRSWAAWNRGCPTTSAGSRRFRSQHPALFQATGVSDHAYAQGIPPNRALFPGDGDMTDLIQLPHLANVLDTLQHVYGSNKRLDIWNTEFGYWTNPPTRVAVVNPPLAAYYLNWAEYISYRNGRLKSYAQYLLADAPGKTFSSGLEFSDYSHKPAFDAYRMPIFLPVTSRTRNLEVWGGVRPAHTAAGKQKVAIQFQAGFRGRWKTVRTVTITSSRGYIDVRQSFPGHGAVRLEWHGFHSRTVGLR